MDGDGQQDRSRTHVLDSKVYTNAERQAILLAWVYVSKNARSSGKPGQNWMEKFYGGIHLIPLLQYPAVSSIDVQ